MPNFTPDPPAPSADDRYRTLFNSIDDGLCVIEVLFDPSGRACDYRFLEANPVFERQSGLVNVAGRTARALMPHLEPQWFEIFGRVAISREPVRFVNHSTARHRWFDVYAFPMDAPEHHRVAILFTDITTRVRAERNFAFLSSLSDDLARLGTVEDVTAAVGAKAGNHLQLAGCAFVEARNDDGAAPDTLDHVWVRDSGTHPGRRCRDLVALLYPSGATLDLVVVRDVATEKRIRDKALPLEGIGAFVSVPLLREGRWRLTLVFYQDQPRNWRDDELQLMREITARAWTRLERARAEAAVRESEARFRTMADSAPVMVWVTEADGRCTYLNRRWYEFTGQTPSTALGSGWSDAVHPEDRDAAVSARASTSGAPAPFQIEYRLRQASGAYAWTMDTAAPRTGPDGEFLGYVGSVIDISARHEIELELRSTNQLKDEFLATLSHELRTPLNAVVGWAHLLRTGAVHRDMQQRALEALERNAKAQAQLVDDLLDVSRIISGKLRINRTVLDLTEIVSGAADTVRGTASAKGVSLDVVPGDGSRLLVSGDPDRLRQVVWNLLSNAVKFTPRGGRVELALQLVADQVHIIVRDSGDGIAPEFLPFVFERFRQADASVTRKHGGLGLGLSIVRHLVEAHGGSVSAESEGVGRGATFAVHLPLGPADRRRVARMRNGRGRPPSLNGARILVLDDEADARELVSAILASGSAEVREARSVAEALEITAEDHIDAVLADIGMPGDDGFTFVERLRQSTDARLRAIPVIALTAYASAGDRERAREAGFQRHLAKPVDPPRLLRALGEVLAEAHQRSSDS